MPSLSTSFSQPRHEPLTHSSKNTRSGDALEIDSEMYVSQDMASCYGSAHNQNTPQQTKTQRETDMTKDIMVATEWFNQQVLIL